MKRAQGIAGSRSDEPAAPQAGRHFALFVAAAVILGFLCGSCFPSWKLSIQPAQVLAGVVHYPESSANYMQQVKLYTIVHQASALLLAGGMGEVTLCRLLSGLEGTLLFLAVGLPVFAFSGRASLAAGSAFLLVRCFGEGIPSVTYPVLLVNVEPNWGTIGLGFIVVAVGLYAAGRIRAANVCVGLAPAMHPALGVWLVLAFGLVLLVGGRSFRRVVFRNSVSLGVGFGITALATGFHFLVYPGYRPMDSIHESARYLLTEVTLWDTHRGPFPLLGDGTKLVASAVVLALVGLAARRQHPAAARYGSLLLASVALAAAGSYGNWYPDRLPAGFMILMPSRTFNVAVLGGFGLWLGLLASRADRVVYQIMLLVAIAALLLQQFHYALPPLTLAAAWALDRLLPARRFEAPLLAAARSLQAMAVAVAALLVCDGRLDDIRAFPTLHAADDPVVQALQRGAGMVVVGGDISMVQGASRRPVLLRDEVDTYAYTPDCTGQVVAILRGIYGIDYFHPPAELQHTGGLGRDTSRTLWERRSVDEWSAIGGRWGVVEVVTYNDWQLQLPRLATGRDLALYAIPSPRVTATRPPLHRGEGATISALMREPE